jgi:hypothetical protein
LEEPFKGFWPDLYTAIEAEFRTGTGIGFKRVWSKSSDGTLDLVYNGEADTTEPYFGMDAFYDEPPDRVKRARSEVFEGSCTLLGIDSSFFVSAADAGILTHVNEWTDQVKIWDKLMEYMDAKSSPQLGVLSEGNWQTVHHLLPEKTKPVIFASKADLLAHTRNSSVDASLMSGLAEDETGLVRFGAGLVSPKTMFTKRVWAEKVQVLEEQLESLKALTLDSAAAAALLLGVLHALL